MIDYGLIFLTGLFASMHCIGMCGALVLAYSLQPAESRVHVDSRGAAALRATGGGSTGIHLLHLAYNAGRVISYGLLGALAGMLGTVVSWTGVVSEYISIAGGILMIVAGLMMSGLVPLPSVLVRGGSSPFFRRLHGTLLRRRTAGSKLALGFLTPLLPCGILYAMLAKAATAGGALQGAFTMSAFALGMAPSLMLLGAVSTFVSARIRTHAERIAAVAVILLGVILLLRGFHLPYLSWFTGAPEHSCCAQ